MAVEITGAAGSATNGSGADPGLTYTVAADADCLVVGVSLFESNGGIGTVTGVTYNGVAMTQVVTTADSFAGGPYTRAYLFRLVAPATGAHAVAVTFSGAQGIVVGAQGFKGVDQTTPVSNSDSATSGAGTSATATVAVTSAVGEYTIDTVTAAAGLSAPTQTQLWVLGSTTGFGFNFGAGSEATGAGSVTYQWTLAASDIWSHVALSLQAAGGGAADTGLKLAFHENRLVGV